MIIIFGLGNPLPEYQSSRHNIGQRILNYLREKHGFGPFEEKKDLFCLISKGEINGKKIFLAKTTAFMNESGRAVSKIMNFYKEKPQSLWLIHDDVDIAFGKIKLTKDRGAAGHHGVESIIQHLNSKDFNRLRLGIWHLPFAEKNKEITQDYVMENFTLDEEKELPQIIEKTASILEAAL